MNVSGQNNAVCPPKLDSHDNDDLMKKLTTQDYTISLAINTLLCQAGNSMD